MVDDPTTFPQPELSPSDADDPLTWKLCLPWLDAWRDSKKAIPTCASGHAWSDLRDLDRNRMVRWRNKVQSRRRQADLPPLPEIDIDPNYPPIGIDSPESSPAPSPPTSPLPDGLALPPLLEQAEARNQGESVAQGPAASSHSMVTRSARQKAAPLPSTKSKVSKRRMYARIPGAKQKKSTGSRGAKATTKPATGSSVRQFSSAQVHPANAGEMAPPSASATGSSVPQVSDAQVHLANVGGIAHPSAFSVDDPTTLPQPERSPSTYDDLITWQLCLPWLDAWRKSNKALPTCASGNAWSDLRNLGHQRMSKWRSKAQLGRRKAGLPPLPEIDIDPNYPAIGIDSPESSPAPSSASPPSPPTSPLPDGLVPQVSTAQVHAGGVAHPPAVVGPTSFGAMNFSPMNFGPMSCGPMGFGTMPQDPMSFAAYAAMFPWCFPYGPTAHPAMHQTFAPQTSAPSVPSATVPQASTSNTPQLASFGSINSTGPFHSSLYNCNFPEFNFDFLEDDVPGSEVVNPNALDVASGAAAGGSTHAEPGPNPPIDDGSNV